MRGSNSLERSVRRKLSHSSSDDHEMDDDPFLFASERRHDSSDESTDSGRSLRSSRSSDSDETNFHSSSTESDGSRSESSANSDRSEKRYKRHRHRRRHRRKKGSYNLHSHEGKKSKLWVWIAGGAVMILLLIIIIYFITSQSAVSAESPTLPISSETGLTENDEFDSITQIETNTPTNSIPDSTSSLAADQSDTIPIASNDSSDGPAASSNTSTKPTKTGGSSAANSNTAAPSTGKTKYQLVQDCIGKKFFACYDFFTAPDPTHGQVKFLDQAAAEKANLISESDQSIIMRVDNTTTLKAGELRNSIRLASKTTAKIGSLIIADIIKMPWGCATWPAWWTVGPDWPNGGEIDILEGVSLMKSNHITLHTSSSACARDSNVKITGKEIPENNNCDAKANGNTGCSYDETAENSYGESFNKAGGGLFATLFTKEEISVWFWSRANIPKNAKDDPDVTTWGIPSAKWPTFSCDIEKFFADQTLVWDITLCGECKYGDDFDPNHLKLICARVLSSWAGAPEVWKNGCGDKAATCLDYVLKPEAFTNAVWEVAYTRVWTV